jgi:hypothetical protein
MKLFLFGMLAAALIGVCSAIYPEGHWDFSTKLTVDTFDDVVKREVDAGKTLFVRWIASAG